MKALSVVRVLFALLALTAVVVQLGNSISEGRSVANFFSYFTIESNIFAATMLLATSFFVLTRRDVGRLDMFRGASTLYMVITGIVYTLLLRDVDVQTSSSWINSVLHYLMPLVMVADWILLPPVRRITFRMTFVWLAFPLVYAAYSLVRGPIVGWYPYPFLDPDNHSYAVIGLVVVVLLGAALLLNALLIRFHRQTPA